MQKERKEAITSGKSAAQSTSTGSHGESGKPATTWLPIKTAGHADKCAPCVLEECSTRTPGPKAKARAGKSAKAGQGKARRTASVDAKTPTHTHSIVMSELPTEVGECTRAAKGAGWSIEREYARIKGTKLHIS